MKLTTLLFLITINNLIWNMEPLLEISGPHFVPTIKNKKTNQLPSLHDLCLNKIIHFVQTNSKNNVDSVASIPPDLLQALLNKIGEGRHIATLPEQGKLSPDATQVLLDENTKPLRVYCATTGKLLQTLDGSVIPQPDYRYKCKWSSTGKYVYAKFSVRENYLYKIWDNHTGKQLYSIPAKVGTQFGFSSNDQFFLFKDIYKPFRIYDVITGKHLADLGDPSSSSTLYPTDPQNTWLVTGINDTTHFYDNKSFALAHVLCGRLRCFSQDGTLLALEEQEDTGQTYIEEYDGLLMFHGPRTVRITKPYACIYNRLFQQLARIPITGNCWAMAISPCNRTLIAYSSNTENHYLIANQQEIKKFTHYHNSDLASNATYSNITGTGTITLEWKDRYTVITITAQNNIQEIHRPEYIDTICYTKNSDLIGLITHKTIRYFLNLTTGIVTPCDIPIKRVLFNYHPTKYLSKTGTFVTNKGDYSEIRQIQTSPKLVPLIDKLKQKLMQAQNEGK